MTLKKSLKSLKSQSKKNYTRYISIHLSQEKRKEKKKPFSFHKSSNNSLSLWREPFLSKRKSPSSPFLYLPPISIIIAYHNKTNKNLCYSWSSSHKKGKRTTRTIIFITPFLLKKKIMTPLTKSFSSDKKIEVAKAIRPSPLAAMKDSVNAMVKT